jgi:hypothetical protein
MYAPALAGESGVFALGAEFRQLEIVDQPEIGAGESGEWIRCALNVEHAANSPLRNLEPDCALREPPLIQRDDFGAKFS